MKRWLAFLVILAVVLLCGCSQKTPHSTVGMPKETIPGIIRPPEPNPETVLDIPIIDDGEPVVTVQYLPENVKAPEGVPVLKWLCCVDAIYGGGTRVWSEDAVNDVNKLLEQKNMPYRVQFIMVTMDRLRSAGVDMFAKPEVKELISEADLLYGYMTSEAQKAYLGPITKYITGDSSPLRNAVPHYTYWQEAMVEGEIYGIHTRALSPVCSGWVVSQPEIFREWGFTEADLKRQFWEMDELFARMYELNGNQPFLYLPRDTVSEFSVGSNEAYLPGILSNVLDTTLLASCFIVDYSSGEPLAVNCLEEENVRAFQQAAVRYRKAGYISYYTQDQDIDASVLRYDGMVASVSPVNRDGTWDHPITKPTVKLVADGLVSGIAAGADHIEEAVSLLSLIAEDEEFRMQLFYGAEGQNYTVENGFYKRIVQEDGSDYSMDFLSPLSYYCGLTAKQDDTDTYYRSPGTKNWNIPGETGGEKLANHRSILDNSQQHLPLQVDMTACAEETENVKQVLRQYLPYFSFPGSKFGEYRQETTEQVYDLMLMDLNAAGAQTIRVELQYQIDQWLRNHPRISIE